SDEASACAVTIDIPKASSRSGRATMPGSDDRNRHGLPAHGAHAAPGRRPMTCGGRTMRRAPYLAATLLAAGLSVGALATQGLAKCGTEPATRLGTDGTRFTVNGRPAFLFGVSYYGAPSAPDETVRRDLADLKKHGFNWVRIWATWAAFGEDVSAVDGEGKPREPFLKRLQWLVAACDEQGVVVDVTLSRGNGSTGPARLQTLEAHRRAVETLVTALKAHRNWYLD